MDRSRGKRANHDDAPGAVGGVWKKTRRDNKPEKTKAEPQWIVAGARGQIMTIPPVL